MESRGERLAWPVEGTSRVPYELYADPGIYAREQERIFRGRSWNYVALAAEIPAAGNYVRSFVGETSVLVTRDKRDAIHVVVNRCGHRGAQLCTAWRGSAQTITCPYHKWTYDLGGQVRGIPLRKGVGGHGGLPAGYDPTRNDLQRLAVTVRNGVVFASFAQDMEPLETYLGESNLLYFDRVFDGRGLRIIGKHRQRISANWKHAIENIRDPYHATLLHTFFIAFGIWRADQDFVLQTDTHGAHFVQHNRRQDKRDDAELAGIYREVELAEPAVVEFVKEFADDKSGTMQTLWPAVIIHRTLNSLAARHVVPRGPEEMELHWTFFGYQDDAPEMVARRLDNASLYGPAGFVSAEDTDILEVVQQGATTHPDGAASVILGGTVDTDSAGMANEAMIRAFYRNYRRIMEI